MPAKNRTKQYYEDAYYHIYNRGVEKRQIFQDEQDYGVFLSYLKDYLMPKDEERLFKIISNSSSSPSEKDQALRLLRLNNFDGEITLIAYCLMPNHFHFLIKQNSAGSIDKFFNSLGTRYTMYFNKKYKRVGSLYQGVYKAAVISTNEQLLHISRYIHQQALKLENKSAVAQPSSYPEYICQRKTEWVKPDEILNFFSSTNPNNLYATFVEQAEGFDLIQNIRLENE